MSKNEEIYDLKKRQTIRKIATYALGIGGLTSVCLAESTENYREEIEDTNKFYGTEVYSTEGLASHKATKVMTWAGALAMLAAAGLAFKNINER